MGAGWRSCDPSDAFETIKRARDERVPVVPLIGAGLSLEAGVPTTTLMIDYMVKVKLLIDLAHRKDHEDMDYSRHLKAGGWPDPDELNDLILVGLQEHLNKGAPDWLGELANPESDLVRTSRSLLGAVRPFTLHEYLRRVQPSLLGFMPRTGSCPFMTAMTDKLAWAFSQSAQTARAGRGEASDADSPEDHGDGKAWDELIQGVGQAIWKSLGDTSSFEHRRERLGEALKAELKRSGLRDRVLRDLELDWRAMLRLLTSGIPSLVDSFFARVLRGHKPATGHQLLGLMAETLGARLWLTTNFDDLIERALRDQSIYPEVYELPDRGPAPDASLFRCGPAVVKLHGSGFALRVGESLDTPLDDANLRRFEDYFPNDAIILVIGYGGGDRRVMSLIERLVIEHRWKKGADLPKVIWVHRGARPPRAVERAAKGTGEEEAREREESIVTVRYRSGGLFLREMYEQLNGWHPASRVAYNALPMLPPLQAADSGERGDSGRARVLREAPEWPAGRPAPNHGSTVGPADPDFLDYPVTLIYGREPGCGTSSFLVNRVNALAATHQVVWCDLAEIPTLDALVDILIDEFRRLDPGLVPPGKLPPLWDGDPSYLEQRIPWMAQRVIAAMRRGKYVVALDSAGEFGRHPLAHHMWGPRDIDMSALRSKPEVQDPKRKTAGRDPADYYGIRKIVRDLGLIDKLRSISGGDDDPLTRILALSQVDHAPIREAIRLYRFLEELCRAARWDGRLKGMDPRDCEREAAGSLGESKLCVALSPPTAPHLVQQALQRPEELAEGWDDRSIELAARLRKSVKKVNEDLDEARRELDEMIRRNNDVDPHGASHRPDAHPKVVVLTPERLNPAIPRPHELVHKYEEFRREQAPGDRSRYMLLRLAAVFRRPRHIIALDTVARDCGWNAGGNGSPKGPRDEPHPAKERDAADGVTGRARGDPQDIREVLRGLSDNVRDAVDGRGANDGEEPPGTFFFYQEGGFYQVHSQVRDSIYLKYGLEAFERARESDSSRPHNARWGPPAWKVHDSAAGYYERLFVHSNSLRPLFEAVYHRIAAHRIESLSSVGARPSRTGLAKLLGALYALLGRANMALLDGPPAQVLAWLNAMQEGIEELHWPTAGRRPPSIDEPLESLIDELSELLIDQLRELQAQICSASGEDRCCIEVRRRQIQGLIHPDASGPAKLIDVKDWNERIWGNEKASQSKDADEGGKEPLRAQDEGTKTAQVDDTDKRKTLKLAGALKSAGESQGAIEIGGYGRDPVKPRHGESANAFLQLAEELGGHLFPAESKGPAHLDSFARNAMKLTFHCKLSHADLILGRLEMDQKSQSTDGLFKEVEKLCGDAEELLDSYSHRFPDYAPRDRAALYLRRARRYYLQARQPGDRAHFQEAERHLEDARAEAYVGRGQEDLDLMAEIRLRTAEGLSAQAEGLLSALSQAVGKEAGPPDFGGHIGDIHNLFDRIRVHLEQARSALSDAHFNFRRWCLWERLRRRHDAHQMELVELLLVRAENLLSALAKLRSANDATSLRLIESLLTQAGTALSISPPSYLVWAEWKRGHERHSRLERWWRELSEGFRPTP